MELTHEEVTKLLQAIDAAPRLGQIDLVSGGFRLQIQRGGAATPSTHRPAVAPAARIAAKQAKSPEGSVTVRAPMLGRFFREGSLAASADADARVSADDAICAIQVGDRSHAVKAGVNGIARCVAPEDGCLVEYGQELFVITPAIGA